MIDAPTPSAAERRSAPVQPHVVSSAATVVPRASVAPAIVDAMYALYASHYRDTTREIFERDLAAKTHVLLLTGAAGDLCGFTTLQLYASTAGGAPVRVLYSGDTIVDPAHWGSSALALEWLRFAGEIERRHPAVPLYWLLMVKGHRTYRFLPAFARRYVPHHAEPASAAELDLLGALATEKFGASFDAAAGLVRFATPQGRLGVELAEVPERHRRLPPVAFFLERNPGFSRGDELVCLCELTVGNLKPFAARAFAPAGAQVV